MLCATIARLQSVPCGKKHLDLVISPKQLAKEKYISDYGDDPYESKKWCHFLQKAQVSKDTKSCEMEPDACPIFQVLKKRDLINSKKVNIKEIWHITEFFHGESERRPICPRKESKCSKMHRLANGGYN